MHPATISTHLQTLIERIGPDLFTPPSNEPLPPVQDASIPLVAHPPGAESVSQIMRAANELGLKVAPRGSGTKLDRGNPAPHIDLLLDLSLLNRVIEHAAGDLTVTVQAGVRLDQLALQLAQAGQFLALDPPIPGTIGGLIATGDSGPRRLRYGGVRDQLLGIQFVRADGTLARGGGKVVKNVAGYDLPKLFTGSLGTLGVITEATFRLYSSPPTSATLAITDCTPLEAASMAASIVDSPLVPTMLDYSILDGSTSFAARFEGPQRSTSEQSERARSLLGKGETLTSNAEHTLWQHFDSIAIAPTLARLIAPQADLGRLLDHAQRAAESAGLSLTTRAHMGHGHALLAWPDTGPDPSADLLLSIRAQAEQAGGNLVLWRAPQPLRNKVEAWGDVGDGITIMRRIKAEFDPRGTLNSGRFAGGI